mgnify:FL=1
MGSVFIKYLKVKYLAYKCYIGAVRERLSAFRAHKLLYPGLSADVLPMSLQNNHLIREEKEKGED